LSARFSLMDFAAGFFASLEPFCFSPMPAR
jgi:hypothetical protein